MGAHVILKLLTSQEKKIKCDAVLNILLLFLIQYNEFDNTTVTVLKVMPKPDMHKHN